MKRLVSRSLGLATMLLASQAFAFSAAVAPGSMPGVNAGSIPGVKVGSIPGVNVNGAVTLHGITVLPNGRLIVPAVTPRVHGAIAPRSGDAGVQMQPAYGPCQYGNCAP
jgi:hypothetical protein